ncbi:DmpA family aminopeptidase [Paraclostridium sordellii]|uniref:Peptidase S58 DmpA n=1 Tax=Paraclostridium sordellii TaxID=1505 RepID=A0A0C7HXF6_PARSO|nr:P1 family peptidase [Paeniclostridium sordellii]CEN77616.1 peptidase S58 DmpA [[Clostridium] sordellii] [Paeniclostridium sordellii]CEO06199.1 peptidase S58 DmpA [[Clostridium] sordellii] [Paeniclostridium sordellii]CEP86426.1 peptidase S58 DmpA [[Clostridium] sordellii] [Paeniclostridium sordellii]CEP96677.1 peptidase S58 DmpA [[Clostridium] sordellii] [Paeniclostridium sordellii]CEP99857.1 peptidase S58 DmpA [[Clostridium] sordellii] [Paeniclostridium sordellii]
MGIEKEYLITIGELKKGKNNLITDVDGVRVGHVTLDNQDIKTGVTAILPHGGNIFKEKVMASTFVINGFGKSIGLIQVDELGTIETPIILTNTLSIGTACTGLIKYMLSENEDIGKTTSTVNPMVLECNDGFLNDIRGLHVKESHIIEAIKNASNDFEEGSVGAGTGMSCYQLKGGIGSSSRTITLDNKEYIVGSLVLSNCGLEKDLILDGRKLGKEITSKKDLELEKGSIIIIIATDIPLSERQLKRVAKRASISLGRTGSHLGNGSGDIVVAFSTANKVNHYEEKDINSMKFINENKIDLIFRASIESIEESIISSMMHSKETIGRDNNKRKSIMNYI